MLNRNEKLLKNWLKRKINITASVIIGFLITGGIAFAAADTTDDPAKSGTGTGSIILNNGTASGENSIVGGSNTNTNVASGEASVALGGTKNIASGKASVVIGGGFYESGAAMGNKASSLNSVVVGGVENEVSKEGRRSTVIGGWKNKILSENNIMGENQESAIIAGNNNTITSKMSAIIAGRSNKNHAKESFIGGGVNNTITKGSIWGSQGAAVIGGRWHKINGDDSVIIGGGEDSGKNGNEIVASNSAIIAGYGNKVLGGTNSEGGEAVVIGGRFNTVGTKGSNNAENSVAIGGHNNTVTGKNSVAIAGSTNNISGNNSVALGSTNTVSGNNSFAIGKNNKIDSEKIYILGSDVDASGKTNAVVLGNNSTAEDNSISVGSSGGERNIKYVKAGLADTDAVNTKQLTQVAAETASEIKIEEEFLDENNGNTYKGKKYKLSLKDNSITKAKLKENLRNKIDEIDNKANKNADNLSATDITAWKTKLGVEADTNSVETVTAGTGIHVSGGTTAKDKNWTVELSTATQTTLAQVGVNTTKINQNTTKINANTTKINQNTTKIDANTTAIVANKNDITTNKNAIENMEISYKTPNGTKKSVKLKEGFIFNGDTNISIETADNGKVNYKLNNSLKGISSIENGLTKMSLDKNKNEVNVNGAKITNVAAGEKDTDAVNVAQLKAASKTAANNRNAVIKNSRDIERVGGELKRGLATSAALAGLKPMQFDPLQKNQVMAAIGSYKDKQAIAVGLNHYFNENLMMNAGVSIGEGKRIESLANIGITWKIGSDNDRNELPERYKEGPIGSVYIMQNEMDGLLKENSKQKNQLRSQEEKINKQAEEMKIMKKQIQMLLENK